ncbi:MAG: alpha/beta fold hydrolase [Spirochaetales bacterium]|nr:alpha/beta fold hydrolase [Spirochaetales bacterium]
MTSAKKRITREAPAVLHGARPFEIHPEGATAGILLIHGYTGRSEDMRFLAQSLASRGYAVSVPRLPGSGTDMEDLGTLHRSHWRRRVYDSWLELRSHYRQAAIVGYSMGGLLALDLAATVDAQALVLLAPALVMTHPSIPFTPYIAPFARLLPVIKTDWTPNPKDNADTREHGRRYWSHRDVRSLAQLSLLAKETQRLLPKVYTPAMGVFSDDDDSVSIKAREQLIKRLPEGLNTSLEVSGCGHSIPQGKERERVAQTVGDWLTSQLSPPHASQEIEPSTENTQKLPKTASLYS